jgi:hypothetical protein
MVLSVAKDLKKVNGDAVEHQEHGVHGPAYQQGQHLRSFATLRMTEGAG